MKFEILDAEDNGEKIVLHMTYDQDFEDAVCQAFGVSYVHQEDVEDFVMMILESLDFDELRKSRD
jgi:hypothetical protein